MNDIELRESKPTSLNRICNVVDWEAWSPLTAIMRELRDDVSIHRKAWEYALAISGLQSFGVVHENARAVSVGAGSERPLYYFANRIAEMVATDLYNEQQSESAPTMLSNPAHFAPFEFRRDRLKVIRMAGDDLKFPDETFDFAFSLSSIEHFGSREIQSKALREMRRVVRPGGILCISTELILNNASHDEYFTYPQLKKTFLDAPGLELVGGDLDLRIAESLVRYPTMMDHTRFPSVAPHVTLFSNGVLFTSVMMFLRRV